MRIIITEEQKQGLFDKYSGNTDDNILTYLKRHFPIYVHDVDSEFLKHKFRYISICDKSRSLDASKKYLVGLIFNCIEDEFKGVDEEYVRRTIKKYIDICRAEY